MKNKTKRAMALWAAYAITVAGGVYGIWLGGIWLGLFLFLGFVLLWEGVKDKIWPDQPLTDLEAGREKIRHGRMW